MMQEMFKGPRPAIADGLATARSWTITLLGRPPRPNKTMRGSFSRDPVQQEKLRKMRLAMQGQMREWKQRTGWAVKAVGIPPLQRARVSAVFFRKVLNRADE